MTAGFDFDIKRRSTGILFAVVALLSAAAIVVSLLALVGESALVLPDASGSNPIVTLLEKGADALTTQAILDPDAEVRGVWIATVNNINFPSQKGLGEASLKKELDAIIENCVKNNLNAVYFQVRAHADAFYNSKIYPTSEYLTGEQGKALQGGFDPLAYLVENGHKAGIKVHAWVNPLRVTYGTKASPAHDVSKLYKDHPARLNPGYTVAYGDGKLYFNAGIPEVRELVVSGVKEIAQNYDVDGIVFDDYFYPYASYTNNKKDVFDDSVAYEKYSNGMPLDDWRRDNINKLVKSCYDAIKETDSEMLFGISPFGIWQNDDGKNGGSKTSGTQSYSELYGDALAWINGGYIDYIAPQLYWQFTTEAARYDTLVRWWNSVCDGTGVDLLISHGVYRYAEGWSGEGNEILNQIEFARSELSYRGSLLYGYDVIKKNTEGICEELELAFAEKIVYSDAQGDNSGVIFNSPANGSTLASLKQTYVLGASDPAYPVYYNGRKLSRTKRGYFSQMLELKPGKNEFVFTQNGNDYIYTLYNGTSQSAASGSQIQSFKIMDEYKIIPVTPTNDIFTGGDEAISVKIKAPAGSEVVCTLGENSVRLLPEGKVSGNDKSKLYEQAYSGKLLLPKAGEGELIDLGELRVASTMGDYRDEITLARVRAGGKDACIPIEIEAVRTGLKVAPDSYYYDDFTSQAQGMRDNAVSLSDGYYLLRVGGYVAQKDARELDAPVPISKVAGAEIKNDGAYTKIVIDSDVNIPLNGRFEDGYFILNLYNVDTQNVPVPVLADNRLFESVRVENSTKKNCYRYHLKLKNEDNFFGFEFAYEGGKTVVKLKNPSGLSTGELPLDGRVIVLDAGHGGRDAGASGAAAEYSEAALNLSIVKSAKDKLEALGASVVLTREDDDYVALADRMNYVEELSPDMMISIHQNSMDYSVDITKIRGLVALYWEHAGRSLSKIMSEKLALALGRLDRGADRQRLAMVRCERYPSTLIEVGFITNVEEYEKISSPQGIEKASQAIADAVIEYYKRQTDK